jgi:HPt (histidine-containing phosphotransfer) domain-containing protein
MSSIPPPTPELAEIAEIVGAGDARDIARSFLATTPRLIADLSNAAPAGPIVGTPPICQIAAHSLKSTARLVGAHPLAAFASALELRQLAGGPVPTAAEIAAIQTEFTHLSSVFGRFAGPS